MRMTRRRATTVWKQQQQIEVQATAMGGPKTPLQLQNNRTTPMAVLLRTEPTPRRFRGLMMFASSTSRGQPARTTSACKIRLCCMPAPPPSALTRAWRARPITPAGNALPDDANHRRSHCHSSSPRQPRWCLGGTRSNLPDSAMLSRPHHQPYPTPGGSEPQFLRLMPIAKAKSITFTRNCHRRQNPSPR